MNMTMQGGPSGSVHVFETAAPAVVWGPRVVDVGGAQAGPERL